MSNISEQLVLVLNRKCTCEKVLNPLKKLYDEENFMVSHRFRENEQILVLDIPVDDHEKIKNRIRQFKKENEHCVLIDKRDFDISENTDNHNQYKNLWVLGPISSGVRIFFDFFKP